MCGQHNGRAFPGDNTGQNIDKGHIPNPRIEIKIPDLAGNRTRVRWVGTQVISHPMKFTLRGLINSIIFIHTCGRQREATASIHP